jgi:hypothetical protein
MITKHDQERHRRRQEFAQQLADVEQELGFRAPPQPPRLSETHEEWQASPHAETHPWLRPDPRPMLHMARWEMQHQREFQQRVHQHEWVMHHRDHFGNISDVIDKVALSTLHLYFENGAEGVRRKVNTFLSKNVDDTILRRAASVLLNRDEPEAAHVLLSSLRDAQ